MPTIRIGVALGAICAAACSPPALTSFTAGGHRLDIRGAVQVGSMLVFSDRPDVCALLSSHREPRSASFLVLRLAPRDPGAGRPFPTGRYEVSPLADGTATRNEVDGTFGVNGEDCRDVASLVLVQGTLDIREAGEDRVRGELDVSFGNDERASGSFEAPSCAADLGPSRCD